VKQSCQQFASCCQVTSLNGRVLGTGKLSVIDDTVIIDRLDVELVSSVQLSVEAKSDFPGAIAAQVTKTSRLHSYRQVLTAQCTSHLTQSHPVSHCNRDIAICQVELRQSISAVPSWPQE